MVYISTDYVFPGVGKRYYREQDATGPLSVYGRTKLAGEIAVREAVERFFIVRISWVFGVNGANFVKTMLRLAADHEEVRVVNDQWGSPTYTADLAPLLCDMVVTNRFGVYHATNDGVCSWAEFAAEIFRLAGKNTRVRAIPTAEYPTKAERPRNSRLSKASLDRAGFKRLPAWRDALERYLGEIE
jgi:dTDP-4-dehydrorhamnose reductase